MNTAEKLIARAKPDKNGCQIWQGATDKRGYGQVRWHGEVVWVHRAFYTIFKGPIPKGTEIDHLCRNRSCVNPEHLEVVSHRENQLRGESFVGKKARQTHCTHGHKFTKANTLIRKDGRRNCRACVQGSDN